MVLVRSFCPNVRFGWHLSELDRCFFGIRGEFTEVEAISLGEFYKIIMQEVRGLCYN